MMPWYEDPEPGPQLVEYVDDDAFQDEATRAAGFGWRIVSVSDVPQRPGCWRFLLMGPFALIFRPRPHLRVVYERGGKRRR